MKKILILVLSITLVSMLSIALVGCGGNKDSHQKELIMHLAFNEGKGTIVSDSSKHLEDAKLQYVFNDATFKENRESEWRETGAEGGSCLFDGYSNYVRYSEEDIKVRGNNITVSAVVAPRYFEVGKSTLTAIVSQYNSSTNSGILLGYRDYGYLEFRVGIGEMMLSVTDSGATLKRYEWNYVCGVYNGDKGKLELYLNGELIGQETFFEGAPIVGCDDYLYIGKNSEGSSNATASLNMFSGLIDDVKIYKAALSSEDVKNNYKAYNMGEIEFEDIWLQNILTDDIYKTQYHGGPYQHWMNEPHAPIYYNGHYHLFFQFNMFGPYFDNICWGHLVSTDMVDWKPIKEVIVPSENTVCPTGVWSGASTYDSNGVPVLLFTAGDNSYRSKGLISNQNIGVARPKNPTDPYLTEWVVDDTLGLAQVAGQGKPGEFRDAQVHQIGDTWYITIASASTTTDGGTALLYTTKDDSFHNWTYQGQLYEIPNQKGDLGLVWELPVLLPVTNRAGTMTKYMLIISPAPADRADNDIYYFLGEFDTTKMRFIPDAEFKGNPHLFDYGNNVFTGPSGFIDPVTRKTVIFSIMQDQRKPGDVNKAGWANCVGLPREVYLSDDGSDIYITAFETIPNHEGKELVNFSNKSITEANSLLNGVKGDMLHITVTFSNVEESVSSFGIKVRKHNTLIEETSLVYNCQGKTIGVKTGLSGALGKYQNIAGNFSGSFELNASGELIMDIYLDRCLLEAFFNEQKAISARIYPSVESLGIEVFSENGNVTIKSLRVAEMESIY